MIKRLLTAALVLTATFASAQERPKVRAITGFVRIEPGLHEKQIAEAMTALRAIKTTMERGGYEVQSLRISTQPFSDYTRGWTEQRAIEFFRSYEQLARKEGFDAALGPVVFAGGDGEAAADRLARVLENTTQLNASIAVADERGIDWRAVRAAARVMKRLEENTPNSQGNFNFAATAMLPANTPFFPGSFHEGAGHEFSIALQSANVVAEAFTGAPAPDKAVEALVERLGKHAAAIEAIARKTEKSTGWKYRGIDLSPAPLKDVSIGAAIEQLTGSRFGASGSMTAAATVTEALRKIPVQKAGYSGLMVPVLEDEIIAQRWTEGTLTLDSLLAYSAVCGTGLDTVPLPGDVTEEQLARIIGDMAALAVKWKKPLSARLMPVKGKKAGESTEFNDPFLVNAVIQPLR
jgi:hypothetical protein